ncbi:MAG: hypothetical protein ACOC05_07470 [Oceanicaulis sp.]
MKNLISLALAAMIFLGVATVASGAVAQERPARAAVSQEAERAPIRAVPVRRASDDRLSPAMQRALESGDMRRVSRVLGLAETAPARATPARATQGQPVELGVAADPQAHQCSGGNCACAGVEDCVKMVDDEICKPKTIGCNANGCACEEADPPADD